MSKTILLLLILCSIHSIGQSKNEITLYKVTKTVKTAYVRIQPNPYAFVDCEIKKKKTVTVIKYVAYSKMWMVKYKDCEGYVPEESIEVTYSMELHRDKVNGARKAEKLKKQRAVNKARVAKEDSIDKAKAAEKLAQGKLRYTPPIKTKYNTRNYSGSSSSSSSGTISRTYITGPRGGCYYTNSNGNKTYVDRSMCGSSSVSRSYSKSRSSSSSGYTRGPRGGCYRINKNGNKTYVARSKC